MTQPPLLQVSDLSCSRKPNEPLFSNLNFSLDEGDILVLQGKSGSGKTTLLKALAHLNLYNGQVLYRGRPPNSYGIPCYRTHVLYVPQRPSLLPGTPRDFLNTVAAFQARRQRKPAHAGPDPFVDLQHAIDVARGWGIDEGLWDRHWSDLSGGEAQRAALAIAVGLDTAEVLLLDEPTSALDIESSMLVEDFLRDEVSSADSPLKALVWVTHSEEQGKRVGTRFLSISNGHYFDGGAHPEP